MMLIFHHLIESIRQNPNFKSTDFLIVVQAPEGYITAFFDMEQEKEKKLERRLRNLINAISKYILAARRNDIKSTIKPRNYYSHFYNKADNIVLAP